MRTFLLFVFLLLRCVPLSDAASGLVSVDERVEWRLLDSFQGMITRSEFEKRVSEFCPDDTVYDYLEFDGNDSVTVWSQPEDEEERKPSWTLTFRQQDPPPAEQFDQAWLRDLRGISRDRPLKGMRICLDPGHIGGDWANLEERYFRIGRSEPVKEGDLTRMTMELIAPQLEDLGAEVVWTARQSQPATSWRPDDLEMSAIQFMFETRPNLFRTTGSSFLKYLNWRKEFLFYRRMEIRARAERIAELQPDVTLCLHYNAAPWRGRVRLFRVNKVVIFVHGSYMPEELEKEEHRYHLFNKVLQYDRPTEIQVGSAIASQMKEKWSWPPENYAGSGYSHAIEGEPYLWSRNLLANRLFSGPVIFVEGPYMNDYETYYRLQAGDYEGTKTIRGTEHRSIFREFSEIVVQGLINYSKERNLME
ncbi:MAG: hypothetical protein AAFY98_06230 [Verrucomicrobiota bacterium]